jgi:hypothetical protein
MLPQYFLANWIGRVDPPPITHPEHFYGFIGVPLAWQVLFLMIAQDPLRYRAVMIPAIGDPGKTGLRWRGNCALPPGTRG